MDTVRKCAATSPLPNLKARLVRIVIHVRSCPNLHPKNVVLSVHSMQWHGLLVQPLAPVDAKKVWKPLKDVISFF